MLPIKSSHFKFVKIVGEGHFGKVFKVNFDPETDLVDLNQYTIPFPKGNYALKQINIKSINEDIKIENITNEINIMEKVSGNQLLAKSKLFPLFYTSFHD